MRWHWREVLLFFLSGVSVAALAVVSISGPINLEKVALISFGSLTAAIAAPMIESRMATQPPASHVVATEPKAAAAGRDGGPAESGSPAMPVDYRALLPEQGRRCSVVGREAELERLHEQLVNQQAASRP